MKKNILVTAVGGRSVGAGILHGLVRSNVEVADRWKVIAADAESFSWGLYKVDDAVILPLAKDPNYIPFLKKTIKELSIDAIIPGSEIETEILSLNRNEFDIPIICNNSELMPLMMDKFATMKKISELGLPTIKTFPISDANKAVSEFGYPIIVKPTKNTGGSKGVSLVTDESNLNDILEKFPKNSDYCIQPYIGDDNQEYTVGVLSDKNGEIIDSIIMKRKLIGLSLLDSKKIGNRSIEISTGYSQGFFIQNDTIKTFCESLAKQLGSTGPLNIQLRLHKNEIYVFEIHPRFSGTSTMRADVGFNEPDILLRNYLYNESFGRLNFKTDVAVIRAFEHVVVPIDKMK